MADTKKEYTSNLHPKGDMDTTVYPNVKSENIIDKDTTAYTAGKVPDSSLVSKSLDGISENLETTKIQVETNKTNIATLQGDVTSLKQDNQTNKANIGKNTQDITTLKANYTEVQSQANTNSSNIALLETNAIKKDTDASLKSLTLPSASDLKTKDGTTFGGGSSLYNGTEFLPTFDISTLKDTYVDLVSNQVITGMKTWGNSKISTGNIIIGQTNDEKPINEIYLSKECYGKAIPSSEYSTRYSFKMASNTLSYEGGVLRINVPNNIYFFYKNRYTFKFICDNTDLIFFDSEGIKIKDSYVVTEATLAADLATKQDKRFVHTVEIHYASNGSYFCFTAQSDNNTMIDSVEKLTTVFSNRDLCGVGIFGSAGISKIHVGSSINDTTFKKYMNNGEYATPSEETFATVFNPTGFTITDSVSAL